MFISLSIIKCLLYEIFTYLIRKEEMPSCQNIQILQNVTLFQQSSNKGTTDVQTRINVFIRNPRTLAE